MIKISIGGCIAHGLASLLPDPASPLSIPKVPPKSSLDKIVDAALVNQQRCLEGSGLWPENVDEPILYWQAHSTQKT